MGRTYDEITGEQARWMESQPVFFVATAALDAHVNVSPRGLDTFRVLEPKHVAWLDLTGSGIETIAHLKVDGRITLMLCAFEGLPNILRLYGRGEVHEPDGAAYDELRPRFPEMPGERAIIAVSVERIADSCSFGAPLMNYVAPREKLGEFDDIKGPQKLADYRVLKNSRSIDGLPGLRSD